MRKLRALGAVPVIGVVMALAQCAPSTTPHVMPSVAPASVKRANNCVPQRSNTFLMQVGVGGQGWWVVQGQGAYDWATGQYEYQFIYGWVETREGTCPNDAAIGYVYDSGL